MDNSLHNMGSSSAAISQLANAEEHRSINGGNIVASQNNSFRVDFVVEPFNKSSHNLGFPLAETRPLAKEINGKSTSSSLLIKDDYGDDDDDVHLCHNMAENNSPLGMENDHRLLTSEKSTASISNNPFSDSVDVTSTSPYSHSVDANLNIFVHNKGELSYDETNHLSKAKDSIALTQISPSMASNVVDFRLSNNTPHGSIPISPRNNDVDVRPSKNSPRGSIPMVVEHKSVTTQNSENQSSPFTSSLNSPFEDPFGVKAFELPYDNTKYLSTEKVSTPLSPNSMSSNVVDVRPSNKSQSQSQSQSQNQMTLMEEHKSITTRNMENQTSPLLNSPFDGQECRKSSTCRDISNKCQSELAQVVNSKTLTKEEVSSNPSDLSIIIDQSPRNKQVTEEGSTTTPKYRIPSHVFAREKSNAHGDQWSTASNDSLFSIQMGGSFTKNRFSLRSGEFNANGDNSLYSHKCNYSSKQYMSIKSGVDMETINEEVSKGQEKPRISQESTISTKSFQFPILTDIDKCNSVNITASPKAIIEQQTDESHTLTAPMRIEAQRPEANASPHGQEKEEETHPKATASWFNFFSCCSCRH